MTRSKKKNPLISYLSGTATSLQTHQVESWINENEANQALFEKLSLAWEKGDQEGLVDLMPKNAPWLGKQKEEEEYVPHDFVANPFPKGYAMFGVRVAATLLIITGIYFLFESKFDAVWDRSNPNLITAQSPIDQELNVSLDDMGNITLKPSSEVQYPTHFQGFTQEIALKGEANFQIHRDADKTPLIVQVEDSQLEVQSGKFTVSQNGNPSIIEVYVEEGSVSFKSQKNATPLYLESGHRVIYAYEDNSIYTEKLYSNISLME